jgi:hypothetical protein
MTNVSYREAITAQQFCNIDVCENLFASDGISKTAL